MLPEDFPIPADQVPARLQQLFARIPVGDALRPVEVAAQYEHDPHGPDREHLLMQMAVVPEGDPVTYDALQRGLDGVVSHSVPIADEKGDLADFSPAVAGCDYIVASWGDSSFFNYYLAEKVWMALGLSARTVGGDHQRVIFDDLGEPQLAVAEGETSNEYEWTAKRSVSWRMRNDYLRRYLWMRGARGVRLFYYSKLLEPSPELEALLDGRPQYVCKPDGGTFELDLRRHRGGLLLQLWATASVVEPDLSPAPDADVLIWPDRQEPTTHRAADALVAYEPVYLDDRFLERYEQDAMFECDAVEIDGRWFTSPSYRGQWSFSECVRFRRNVVRVPMRELYKPKPDREIVHAYRFALTTAAFEALPDEEHIVAKTGRLVATLLDLGDALATLGARLEVDLDAQALAGLSRREIEANHWSAYPHVRRLARVAPLDMSQAAFLSRCKALNEIVQRVPDRALKSLLEKAGCNRRDLDGFKTLKLLQALLTILQEVQRQGDDWSGMIGAAGEVDWRANNPAMAALFLNNDLRNAEAHEAFEDIRRPLDLMNFDTALLNEGYGRALDHVFDGVIAGLSALVVAIDAVIDD